MMIPHTRRPARNAALLFVTCAALGAGLFACATNAGASDAPTPATTTARQNAVANGALTASVSRGGAVTIRRARDGKVIATVTPGLFETTWQFRGVGSGGAFDNANAAPGVVQTRGTIGAPGANTSVNVRGDTSNAPATRACGCAMN
jgi:putative hemolysin